MKKILTLVLIFGFGCAGLNHDMLANSLNNSDEQSRECKCKCKKAQKKNKKFNMAKYEIFDNEDLFHESR